MMTQTFALPLLFSSGVPGERSSLGHEPDRHPVEAG